MIIIYSKHFSKAYKKLPANIKLLAEKKESIFRLNPFDTRLKTHKLKGELQNYYSLSVAFNWRIVFHFINQKTIGFDIIGTHEVYK